MSWNDEHPGPLPSQIRAVAHTMLQQIIGPNGTHLLGQPRCDGSTSSADGPEARATKDKTDSGPSMVSAGL